MSGTVTYQVRYRKIGTTTWTNYGPPVTNLTETINNLQVDASYEVSVVASNTGGSVTSVPVQFQTQSRAPSVPGTPTASLIHASDLTVNWTASQLGSIPILYQLQYRLTGGGAFANLGSPVTNQSLHIVGLTAGTSYDFQVVASNSVGFATSGILTVSTATVGTVPAAPTGLIATGHSTSSVTLSWTASATGSTPITYQPRFRVSGAASYTAFGGPISGTSVTITGLASNTSYDFLVDAINSVGTTTSAVFTNGTPPGSITLSSTLQTASSISLAWTAPTGPLTVSSAVSA
jgi:hypothetical protein